MHVTIHVVMCLLGMPVGCLPSYLLTIPSRQETWLLLLVSALSCRWSSHPNNPVLFLGPTQLLIAYCDPYNLKELTPCCKVLRGKWKELKLGWHWRLEWVSHWL